MYTESRRFIAANACVCGAAFVEIRFDVPITKENQNVLVSGSIFQ